MLSGKGPFTVFAPTNEAFADPPAGTVPGLLMPAAKAKLVKVLTYHVGPGDHTTTKLRAMILADGGTAHLTVADVAQSNGVIQVVDHVLMP